ncbi:hypothetical protein BROUX41_004714 [Berkeleyomyces rouxiae]|uniref:uncharacterized protein n=1 Tax=Berkeleyomyces rouxiae TaxID=2035830 RepID=UPI003B8131BB
MSSQAQLRTAVLVFSAAVAAVSQNFTIANGQIFTPGFVVVDAPQPGTPMGGDTLHVALDITANGRLQEPPYDESSPSLIRNITMFLFSYKTGRNFTIANATEAPDWNILNQELGSTVKHVNWLWPDCLMGDGKPRGSDSDRGEYNISIHQNFRLNNQDHYTVFDLPISVTNSIPENPMRPFCDAINNALLPASNTSSDDGLGVLFEPGDATVISTNNGGSESDNGLGTPKTEATPGDGLGSEAAMIDWKVSAVLASGLWIGALGFL